MCSILRLMCAGTRHCPTADSAEIGCGGGEQAPKAAGKSNCYPRIPQNQPGRWLTPPHPLSSPPLFPVTVTQRERVHPSHLLTWEKLVVSALPGCNRLCPYPEAQLTFPGLLGHWNSAFQNHTEYGNSGADLEDSYGAGFPRLGGIFPLPHCFMVRGY